VLLKGNEKRKTYSLDCILSRRYPSEKEKDLEDSIIIRRTHRFGLEFHEYKKKERLSMIYTRENEKKFIRWGEFRLKIDGKEVTLQAYKSNLEDEGLFVPFRDLTSGMETYGAGRYIDLNADVDRTPDGRWILDFNKAYNPWCAYNEDYTCPLVPKENWLEVPIYAGEKKYGLKKGENK